MRKMRGANTARRRLCGRCGHPVGRPYRPINVNPDQPVSAYSGLVALLLCFFLGYLGIHRFYVGKIGTGISTWSPAACSESDGSST